MKRLMWLIVCLMTMVLCFTSCAPTYNVSANYDVCYPDGTKTQTKTIKINSYSIEAINVVCHSFNGTNYISVTENDNPLDGKKATNLQHIVSTTAPMRLNDYNVVKVKKPKREIQKIHYNW